MTAQTPATAPDWLTVAKDLGPVLIALGALFITVLTARWNLRHGEQTLALQRNQERSDEITRQLDGFYGPIRQLLAISGVLHLKFKNGRNFQTLVEILRGERYTGNDAVLLQEIMNVTSEIEVLIMKYNGIITDTDLRQTLAKVGAHFRILRAAASGALAGEPDRFADVVFPKEIHDQLAEQVRKLEDERAQLRRGGAAQVRTLEERAQPRLGGVDN